MKIKIIDTEFLKENIYLLKLMLTGILFLTVGSCLILIGFGLIPLFLLGIIVLKYSAIWTYNLLKLDDLDQPSISSRQIETIKMLTFKDFIDLKNLSLLAITNLKLLFIVFIRAFTGVFTFTFVCVLALLSLGFLLAPIFYIIDLLFPSDYIQYLFVDLGMLSIPVNGVISILIFALGIAIFYLYKILTPKLYNSIKSIHLKALSEWV